MNEEGEQTNGGEASEARADAASTSSLSLMRRFWLEQMQRPHTPRTVWQAASLLYLVLPLAIFFVFFSSYLWAVAGFLAIAWSFWSFTRGGVVRSVSNAVAGALLALAGLFVGSSGILPGLWQNLDYAKHYAILKLLVEHPWPVVIDAGKGPEALRYYLGWYLVPAGLSKLLGQQTLDYTLAAWTTLGLWLFFLLLAETLKQRNQWLSVPASILTMFFSGMDRVGISFTGHLIPYPDHFEWWAWFYQFSSLMTDLVWVPQHGLASWLAVGLLLNAARGSRLIGHAGLLLASVFFWSPLCAVGVLPFVLVLAAGRSFRDLFSVSNVLMLAAVAPPLLGYLFASTGQIPHTWIFQVPGWTVQNLMGFWLLEFGIFALLVWVIGTPRKQMFCVAVAALLLIPLFSLGAWNDFAMRASIAPLTALAFIGIEVMLTKPWRSTVPLMIVFVFGLSTPFAEISRSFTWAPRHERQSSPQLIMKFDASNPVRMQYLTPYPNRFLRAVSAVAAVK